MQEIFNAIMQHDLKALIQIIGYPGVFGIIFAESGLLIGFFLPGDSLLFTAGLLAAPSFGFFNIWVLLIGSWIAAVVGDNVGYEFGKHVGRKLFKKEKAFLFNPDNLIKAQEFYEKHGGKAIILARFIPVVRTFVPIVAGVAHMNHLRFMFFNFIGGTVWVWGLVLAGYFLGSLIKDVDKYLLPIVALIVLISVAPAISHLYKERHKTLKEKFIEKLQNIVRFFKYKI